MAKYKVETYMPDRMYTEKTIECGRLEIRETCFCFWTNVYGKENRLVASYPIHYTVVTEIYDEEE